MSHCNISCIFLMIMPILPIMIWFRGHIPNIKYERDSYNLTGTFARSRMLFSEKLTNGALVTPAPGNQCAWRARTVAWIDDALGSSSVDNLAKPCTDYDGGSWSPVSWQWPGRVGDLLGRTVRGHCVAAQRVLNLVQESHKQHTNMSRWARIGMESAPSHYLN